MSDATSTPTLSGLGAIYILDDDEGVLGYLKLVVQQMGFEVHGFQDPEGLFTSQSTPPMCLIVDWQLRGVDGLDVIKQCNERWVNTPVILISGQATIPVAVSAMRLGVVGVLEKPVSPGDLRREIQQAIDGATQRRNMSVREVEARTLIDSLNDNERSVLEKLVKGTANKKIASEMELSMRSIEKYRAALFSKLGVTSAAEATQIWMLAKTIEQPD